MTVKLWRPHSADQAIPTTLGNHADYVKCLASPGDTSTWVASGGLDRKIILWDVNGKGEIQKIEVGEGSEGPKGSIYALGTGGGVLASGGPEKVVRIWDPHSGKRITKFVGHIDNVRSILLSDDGRTMLTASSDTTIKLWSLATRRCMHTFTMHSDSVWTLHSLHPRLEVFHAGDRGGLVTKTDIRGVSDIDEAECVAVYKEHHGVTKIVAVGNRVWSATSSSSINRWLDTPDWDPLPSASTIHHRTSSTSRHRPSATQSRPSQTSVPSVPQLIPSQAFLRLTSIHDALQVGPISHKDQDVVSVFSALPPSPPTQSTLLSDDPHQIVPVREEPDTTIAGQHGLIKHILLNDRRRVLTLDTSHTIALWDIVQCKHLQSFGAKDIYEIEKHVNSNENVPNWCTVDTRIGSITVMLDERSAFDAEVYRDEIGYPDEGDQRINIGKWVLRYLFANLIDAELQKDKAIRTTLEEEALEKKKKNEQDAKGSPLHISIPPPAHTGTTSGESTPRPRPYDGAMSPGIGLATPAPIYDPAPSRISYLSPGESEFTPYSPLICSNIVSFPVKITLPVLL
jgi:WD repeat-containing protein 48